MQAKAPLGKVEPLRLVEIQLAEIKDPPPKKKDLFQEQQQGWL